MRKSLIFSIFAYRKRGKIPLTPNQIKPKVMNYRAKCTHCEKMVIAIYQGKLNYFVRDANDVYVEARTEAEAEAIEILDKACAAQEEAIEQLLYIRDYANSTID